ncbi:DUF2726 domain-containing protein [Phenylobacterium sp. LjRoot219]|uniref:DUF2726 domain-containing protein n=1 Tax=Phenylobacterium sp. LjRoot219 TaxID=3342283 RepID=UPI003ED148D6
MDNAFQFFLFAVVAGAFLLGIYGRRWRSRLRAPRKARRPRPTGRPQLRIVPPSPAPAPPLTPEAADQLRYVMTATFRTKPLLSSAEARILRTAEVAIAERGLPWRVMAQVCLGEILASPNARAYAAINSKRVDLLLINAASQPIAAIEHQGTGHYQGAAPVRDAVKTEALRRAGVRYIEITSEHRPQDLAQEIDRLAAALGVGRGRPPASEMPAAPAND